MGSASRLRSILWQGLQGAAALGVAFVAYWVVLRWRGQAAAIETQTAWDRAIPFWPAWLYVYLAPYPIAPLLMGLMRRQTFLWLIGRGLIVLIVSLVVFVALPTRTVRPTAHAGDGFTGAYYRSMTAIDEPPANAAPSLHISLTGLLALALLRDFRRWSPVILTGTALVWLATLFTWQHHLIDVLTGAVLCAVAAWPWTRSGGQPAPS
jgi:membrane-associated phospholipid phosphatase